MLSLSTAWKCLTRYARSILMIRFENCGRQLLFCVVRSISESSFLYSKRVCLHIGPPIPLDLSSLTLFRLFATLIMTRNQGGRQEARSNRSRPNLGVGPIEAPEAPRVWLFRVAKRIDPHFAPGCGEPMCRVPPPGERIRGRPGLRGSKISSSCEHRSSLRASVHKWVPTYKINESGIKSGA